MLPSPSAVPGVQVASGRATSDGSLPPELLAQIMQLIIVSSHSRVVNQTLLAASLVCRAWRDVAQSKLLSAPLEFWSYRQVDAFLGRDIDRTAVISMSLVVHPSPTVQRHRVRLFEQQPISTFNYQPFTTFKHFSSILNAHPELRQLTLVFLQPWDEPSVTLPSTMVNALKNHPALMDLTVLNPLRDQSLAALTLCHLPPSIRFLSLPEEKSLNEPYVDHRRAPPPNISLLGFTFPTFPSDMATWLLTHSKTSLQSLTLGDLLDTTSLVANYLNIRSLKVINPIGNHSRFAVFSRLVHLERFEVHGIPGGRKTFKCLPTSIRYLRFWTTETAVTLLSVLSDAAREILPNLQTVVWDCPVDDWAEVKPSTFCEPLRMMCKARGIEFKLKYRIDGNGRSSYGPDEAYEKHLRALCCGDAINPSIGRVPVLPSFPARITLSLKSEIFGLEHPQVGYVPENRSKYEGPVMDEYWYYQSVLPRYPVFTVAFRDFHSWIEQGFNEWAGATGL